MDITWRNFSGEREGRNRGAQVQGRRSIKLGINKVGGIEMV